MFIKVQDLSSLAFGVSNNPEGFPSDQAYQAFYLAYVLYLARADAVPALRQKRLKTIQVQNVSGGVDISELGTKKSDKYNDFLVPFDVYQSNAAGTEISTEVDEQDNQLSTDKGWYVDGTKIYFTGYTAGDWFRVRYLPEVLPFNETNYDKPAEVEMFIAQVHIPRWVKFLLAMQANIEEESIPLDNLEFQFEKYFEGMENDVFGLQKTQMLSVDQDNLNDE